MKILIANPGSTSYKCKLYDTAEMSILFEATVERIGSEDGIFSYHFASEEKKTTEENLPDYHTAISLTLDALKSRYSPDEVVAVGFKTVLAKDHFGCVDITDEVLDAMEEYRFLAPVHTDVYITAINIFKELLPSKRMIALFETHFHVGIPEEARLFGIPYEWTEKYGIRKLGFHGSSHRYVGKHAKELFGADKVISCHLGGSASVCAIKDGWSIDTSMAMSPQSGLLNAKRVGDLDPFALLYLMQKEDLSPKEIGDILMSNGGLKGISGISSGDFRDIQEQMSQGNERAHLAFKSFAYHVRRYIGEYLVALNGAECIVFTAGAGENNAQLREEILANLDNLGIKLDQDKNVKNPVDGLISTEDSKVKVAVIATNEEYIVASAIVDHLEEKVAPS